VTPPRARPPPPPYDYYALRARVTTLICFSFVFCGVP
jgi:hypothetical protein